MESVDAVAYILDYTKLKSRWGDATTFTPLAHTHTQLVACHQSARPVHLPLACTQLA